MDSFALFDYFVIVVVVVVKPEFLLFQYVLGSVHIRVTFGQTRDLIFCQDKNDSYSESDIQCSFSQKIMKILQTGPSGLVVTCKHNC